MRRWNGVNTASAETPIQLGFAISKSEPEIKNTIASLWSACLRCSQNTIEAREMHGAAAVRAQARRGDRSGARLHGGIGEAQGLTPFVGDNLLERFAKVE